MPPNSPLVVTEIVEGALDPAARLAAFETLLADGDASRVGALASFVGKVRGRDGDGLVLTHYPPLTGPMVAALGAEAAERFGLLGLLIVHRVGAMAPGEPIVLTVAASAHRRAALDAVDMVMDRLKSTAPFWKQETGPDGARWIEPTLGDTDSLSRWSVREEPHSLRTQPSKSTGAALRPAMKDQPA